MIMTSCSQNDCSNPLADQFTLNSITMCPKGIKSQKFLETLGENSRVLAASLMVQTKKPPLPPTTPSIGLILIFYRKE